MSRTHSTTARFTVAGWKEEVLVDIDQQGQEINGVTYPKRGFSRADVSYAYSGPMEGTSVVAYLISYRPGPAPIAGFEHFTGSIDGHDGSIVLQHVGEQDSEGVRATLQVVSGMGTGGLEGLTGEATVEIAGHSDTGYEITLAYDP